MTLVFMAALVVPLAVTSAPAGAACPVPVSGDWIGTYSFSDGAFGGAVQMAEVFSGTQLTGTASFIEGAGSFFTGASLRAKVNCANVVNGVLGDTGRTTEFAGTLSADGNQFYGTWNYDPTGFNVTGTWSTARVLEQVSTVGTSLTTDSGSTGATPADPMQVSVNVPTPGDLVIQQATAPSLSLTGYQTLEQVVKISAPDASSASNPLAFTFELDASALAGVTASGASVFRNGALVADCTGAAGVASPDPCVADRTDLPNGNVRFRVLTTRASVWSFGIDPADITGLALSVGTASTIEGSGGTKRMLRIPVTLSEPSTAPVSVHYSLRDGTASAGTDYFDKMGVLVFKPGRVNGLTPVSRVIAIPVNPDTVAEGDETLSVVLSGASGAAIAHSTGTATIIDDDPTLEVGIGVGDASIYEGTAGATRTVPLTITLTQPSPTPVTVTYAVTDAGATAGNDYSAHATGTLVFKAFQVSKTVSLKTFPDRVPESDEAVAVTLSAPVGATLTRATGTLTLLNDD